MMTTLHELQEMADAGYGRVQEMLDGESLPPAPPVQDSDLLEAYHRCGLSSQGEAQQFKINCWQATELGFPMIGLNAVAHRIADQGDAYVAQPTGKHRLLEYYLDIASGKEYRPCRTGGGKRMEQSVIVKADQGGMPWPLSTLHDGHEMHHRPIDEIRVRIPYGVVLRVEEIRKAKVFSFFSVVAPSSLFADNSLDRTEPVVLGNIARGPIHGFVPEDDGVRHFVIARWANK